MISSDRSDATTSFRIFFTSASMSLTGSWAKILPRVGLRATSTVNLRLNGCRCLSHLGGGLAVPIHPGPLGDWPAQGLYIGPYAGFTALAGSSGTDLTLASEVGARWALGERWTVNLAGQLGASALRRGSDVRWVQHLGLFPSIGVWIR